MGGTRLRLAEARGEAEARVDQDAAQPLTEGGDDTGQQVQHYARTARKEGRSGECSSSPKGYQFRWSPSECRLWCGAIAAAAQ